MDHAVVPLHTARRARRQPETPAPTRDSEWESEERLALVNEAATEGLYDWNITDNQLYVSPRLNRMFGFTGGHFESETWFQRVHPEDRQIYRQALVDLFRGRNERLAAQYRILNIEEQYIWARDNAVAVRDEAGRAVRLVGAISDITARKQAEAALQESQQRYELAMAAVSEGVYDWNIENDETYYSPGVRSSIGLSEEQVRTTQDWLDQIHPDDLPNYLDELRLHLKGESERFVQEFRFFDSDGTCRWARQHGLSLRHDKDGRAYRMAGSIADITEERRLSEDLEQVRRQLFGTIESISEGFVVFDRDNRLVICNDTYRQFYIDAAGGEVADLVEPGTSRFDILGAAFDAGMFPDTQDSREEFLAERRRRQHERRRAVEIRFGSDIWVQVNEMPMQDGGFAAVYTDITELKQRQAELSEKSSTLQQLSSQLAKYLSPQVYESIFAGRQEVKVASRRKKLTVLFSDIENFTEITESLESEELSNLLNEYLTEMSRIALAHGATIDKYIGDAMVLFFGDPESQGPEADAKACVRMAVAMQQRMAQLQQRWRDRGLERPFRMRIGINTGYCTVGNFGSEDRLDYTIIGNEVNLTARLQQNAEPDGILLAHETHALVRDEIATEKRQTIRPKGFSKPVRTYEVVDRDGESAGETRILRKRLGGVSLEIDRDNFDRSAALAAIGDWLSQLENESGTQSQGK
jgi:PAS domain S-box-containing protein